MKYILVTIVILTIISILNISYLQSKIILEICNINKTANRLTIEYKIINKGNSSIWMCQILSVRSSLEYDIKIDREGRFVKIRRASFKIPKGVDLDQPIIGKYVNIKQRESYKGRLKLNLPLKELNPFYPYKKFIDQTNIYMADKVIFEVGIIRKKLKSNVYEDNSGNKFALVNCVQIERYPELILSETIENISVPCLKLKTENRETILRELLMEKEHHSP